MQKSTVLLSGATGFLGSHLAEYFSLNGHKVLALVRNSSDLTRVKEFRNDNLVLVNTDTDNHIKLLTEHRPSCFIHTAWQGVSVEGRNDPKVQNENIVLTRRLLFLAQTLKIKKVIALGSQAEYGNFHGRISEDAVCKPISAYGKAKLATLDMLRVFCEEHSMQWYWIRIFSVYGTREKKDWLIPSVIRSLLNGEAMDLTACEQRYDYLYAKDFWHAVMKVVQANVGSGIFNLGSNTSIRLREMIEKIKTMAGSSSVLNFGALPYRPDQVMHMEGDSTKFNAQFHFEAETSFEKNMEQLISYYRNQKLS